MSDTVRLDAYGRPLTAADLAREAEERRVEEEHREGGHDDRSERMQRICQSCAEADSDRRRDI
jgi:hypothetical protein